MTPPFPILYEDNHLLVIDKPAGLPTQGAARGEESVVELAKDYLARKYNKPGNVYLGVVSRLDRLVTGVLVLARTSKAAARLSEQFRTREPEKTYLAIVEPAPREKGRTLVHWLAKDEAAMKIRVVAENSANAQQATLLYKTLRTIERNGAVHGALVEIKLQTGRKHQIRVQMAAMGCPVVGDTKYGAPRNDICARQGAIALHARFLTLEHPTQKTALHFAAPLPSFWEKLGIRDE